jgi:hypothetical protein
MPPLSLPALPSGKPTAWDEAIYAFLVEKRSRSGSTRTVESYARMLWPFFRVTAPDQVRSADVLAYAHGIGLSGRVPSSTTVGARIACLSSFYRFTIRMGLLAANPCDALERPRTVQSVARGLSADEVRRLLAVFPDTVAGRRDRALLLTFVLTGRRRAEVIGLTAGDISLEGETAFYRYRGKGGQARSPGAATTRLRGAVRHADRCWAVVGGDGPRGLTLAGGGRLARRDELDVLCPVPPVPPGGGACPDRVAHPPPHRGEAPAGCRGVDRGGEQLPRPQLACRHERLPPAARRGGGPDVAGSGRGDRGLAAVPGRNSLGQPSQRGRFTIQPNEDHQLRLEARRTEPAGQHSAYAGGLRQAARVHGPPGVRGEDRRPRVKAGDRVGPAIGRRVRGTGISATRPRPSEGALRHPDPSGNR